MATGRKLQAKVRNWSYGLGRRVVFLSGVMAAVFIAAFVFVNLKVQRGFVEDRLIERADAITELLREIAPPLLYSLDTADLKVHLETRSRESGVEALFVADADGLILADSTSGNDRFFTFINDDLLARALASRSPHTQRDGTLFRLAVPLFVGDEFLGVARADISLDDLNATTATLWRTNLLFAAAFLALGILLSMVVASRVTIPLKRLISATDAAAQGNYEQDASINTNDEFEALSTSFNKMLVALRESLHEINSLAYVDTLTGLPNRRFFSEYLEKICDRVEAIEDSAALLFVDLDRFKQINDTLGHDIGDELLVEVGTRIRRALLQQGLIVTDPSILRQKDKDLLEDERALLARLGGDEFTVVLSCEQVRKRSDEIAREMLASLGEPLHIGSETLNMNASIGIAFIPEHGASASAAMKNADIAMYQAKTAGRGTFRFYDADMAEGEMEQIRVETDLKRALEKNEFEVHFQPQFWTRTGRLYGAEALVRWQHPERGLLAPADFLPVAEATGLMPALGRKIMQQAIRAAARWPALEGGPIHLGLNMSVEELQNPENQACLFDALDGTGFDPHFIEIEVTEGTAMQDDKALEATFEQFHAQGIRLSVDDFGVGYSNLARLRALNFDTLKIDSSLVRHLTADDQSELLVTSIQQMAQALGVRVIAEGVTSAAHVKVLQAIGCEVVQGFALGHPMKDDDFAFYLAEIAERSGKEKTHPTKHGTQTAGIAR